MKRRAFLNRLVLGSSIAALLVMLPGCSKKAEPSALKKMPAGAQYAGFLSDYSKLKPHPAFENTMAFVNHDEAKNIHKYIAVIVEPVELYVSTNADPAKIPDRGRTAVAAYFNKAIVNAVGDAFPVVAEPGPLVLRLRTALVGVDVGADIAAEPNAAGALERGVDIAKVGVEMEMVDSMTGEQIVAAVDRQNLGAGAVVGSENFSREEKFAAAKEAFDGWAARLRDFLDSAQQLSEQDAQRADESYHPYGEPAKGKP